MKPTNILATLCVLIALQTAYGQDSTRLISITEEQARKADKALTYLQQCEEVRSQQKAAILLYKEAIQAHAAKDAIQAAKENEYKQNAVLRQKQLVLTDEEIKRLKRQNRRFKLALIGSGAVVAGVAIYAAVAR